jgi:subtilisin-like proprotein convertase family protein
MKFNILIGFLLAVNISFSQTFSGNAGPIADNSESSYTLNVNGLTNLLDTNNFGLETICLNLTHTYLADLEVRLISPSGVSILLFAGIGGGDDNLENTCLNVDASQAITEGFAPFTGTFRPSGQMGLFNNQQTGNGVWTLKINDTAGQDFGDLVSWSLTFGNNPASYFVFTSSNLPIVVINTNGQNIQDDPKISADMGIIFNGEGIRNYTTDPKNNYNGKIGIEYRGSSSQMFPKKPFGIELWDLNNNSIDSSILNMPKDNDWILGVAYSDKSLMRNSLTFRTWEKMGYYAPRGENVELILNGEYWGVYYLCEKIKRGNDRLDIAKLDPIEITGDDVTGGYILKIDKGTGSAASEWQSNFPPANNPDGIAPTIMIDYPSTDAIVPQQFNYIKNYVDSFETALATIDFLDTVNGYRHFADEASFIDYLLISEMNKNVDGYRISTFFSKDKTSKGGKLKMGPVWDYDLAYGNANYCEAWDHTGFSFDFNTVCGDDTWQIPFWWNRMMEDTLFQNNLRCRWENLKPIVFDTTIINQYLDSMAARLNESQIRNYNQWPIIGTYVWPNYFIGNSYQAEVDTLKWWIKQRFEWLDANIPGNLIGCGFTNVNELNSQINFEIYPNPFQNQFTVHFNENLKGTVEIKIMNLIGEEVFYAVSNTFEGNIKIELSEGLPAGVYFVEVKADGRNSNLKKLLKD